MKLSDMDSRTFNPSVLLLQTPSIKLSIFIEDKLKRHFKVRPEAIIDVSTVADFKKIKQVIGTNPPFSERWFVKIDLDKLFNKDLVKLITQSTTCVFLCTCSKYKTFKSFKEALKKHEDVYDLYINYLRKTDFIYLYDAFTPSDNKLPKNLFDYVVQSYSGDIDAIFKLFLNLADGVKFENRNDIAKVCGLGGLSIESYIFGLLKPISGSAKGLNIVLRNRIKAGIDLGNTVGFSSMYNFMSRSIRLFCELKMLVMSGVVYKQVRNLPESFDEKALARYQKYLWRLREVPMTDLLKIRQCMGKRVWKNELDFLNFIYKYYNMLALEHIKYNGGM